jgi:hypothetical protein
MSTAAIATMVLAVTVLFGGLVVSIASAVRSERRAARADRAAP